MRSVRRVRSWSPTKSASRPGACCRSSSPAIRRSRSRKSSQDMKRPQPMNRLLQGDVGSGKTIVAMIAAVVAMENGFQVAFMAPTEILAEQHFITIRRLLEPSRFRVALLTGATPAKKRREMQAELAGGSIHLAVGTHALVAGSGRLPRAWSRRHRRAAPVRRAAARDAPGQGSASRRAGDDRDADSADARADDLRRSRRLDHAGDAARTAPDQDRRQAGIAARRDLRLHPAADRRRPAGRTSSIRWWRSRRRSISRPRRKWPTTWRRTSFPRTASRCCTDG